MKERKVIMKSIKIKGENTIKTTERLLSLTKKSGEKIIKTSFDDPAKQISSLNIF